MILPPQYVMESIYRVSGAIALLQYAIQIDPSSVMDPVLRYYLESPRTKHKVKVATKAQDPPVSMIARIANALNTTIPNVIQGPFLIQAIEYRYRYQPDQWNAAIVRHFRRDLKLNIQDFPLFSEICMHCGENGKNVMDLVEGILSQ